MAGWADIGAALVGNPAGNELAYQKGLSLGAATQNAMQLARERVRQNTAMEQLPGLADELGLPAAYVTAMQAGINPEQVSGARKQIQEIGFRDTAADPNSTPEQANVALRGVASGPVERYYAVGKGGYADKFADNGVMAAPHVPGGDAGEAAAIQTLRAFGLLGPDGHVIPGQERKAFDVMRTTGRTVDMGGVPNVIDFNPFAPQASAAPVAPTAPPAVPAGIGAELAPPMPAAAPAPAPAAPVARPVSTAAQVGANAATIAKAKEMGKTQGDAAAKLPTTIGTFKSMSDSVDSLLTQPGFDSIYGNLRGTGVGQEIVKGLSQDAANADAAREQLKSQGFTVAIQKMRGLGQLSNAEGSKVEAALSRLWNPRISPEEARKAAAELKVSLANMERTARAEAGDEAVNAILSGGGAAPGAAPSSGAAMSLDAYLKSKGF